MLIVGAGPAGMIAAAQLSQFSNVTTRIIERRAGRLEVGQADGIQTRSVETFQAFGFAERIIAEAYRITQMAFWKPDPDDPRRIIRTALVDDDPTGISEFPHLIVNQARVQDYFAEVMALSPSRMTPDYGYEFVGLTVAEGERAPGRGDTSAHRRTGCRPGAHRAREVRGRLRRGAQRGARVDRAHAGGRPGRCTPGASWTCWPSPTFPTSAPSARSSRTTAATSS